MRCFSLSHTTPISLELEVVSISDNLDLLDGEMDDVDTSDFLTMTDFISPCEVARLPASDSPWYVYLLYLSSSESSRSLFDLFRLRPMI